MTSPGSSLTLPETIVERLVALGSADARSAAVSGAISSVLQGTPDYRRALMQSALPLMDEPLVDFAVPSVGQEVLGAFEEYCQDKKLRSDVLLTGALMAQLGITSPPSAEKPWWKFW